MSRHLSIARASVILLLSLALPMAVCAQEWPAAAFKNNQEGVPRRPSPHPDSHKKQAAAPEIASPLDVLYSLFTAIAPSPTGVKQAVCLDSTLFHVEDFPGTQSFKRGDLLDWAKSTVRLRITHAHLAEKLFAPKTVGAQSSQFSLGGFAPIAGKDEGICTGTLIAGNIVLTAGHCVSRAFWDSAEQGVEFPHLTSGNEKRYLSSDEFAKLLVADFNYQLDLSKRSLNDDVAPAMSRPLLSFTVRQLVRHESSERLDYAILRIAGAPEQIGGFALGAAKIQYARPSGETPVAVVQHPLGFYKKVAVGTSAMSEVGAILHSASTAAGSSGAPVLDARGRLVAVHIEGGCEKGSSNKALPLSRFRAPLNSALNGSNR